MARLLILVGVLVGCSSGDGPVFGGGGEGDRPEAAACPAGSFQVGQVARSPFLGEPWIHLRWGLPQIFGPTFEHVATGEVAATSTDADGQSAGFLRFDSSGEVAAFGSLGEEDAPPRWAYVVTREDDRVSRVDYEEDGVVALELASLSWEGDQLLEVLGQEDSSGRDLYTYTYEDGRIVSETVTIAASGEDWVYHHIDWSEDGGSAVVDVGDGDQVSEVRYDAEGLTEGWTTTRSDGQTFETALSYDAAGRLVEQLTLDAEGEVESLLELEWADHGGLTVQRAWSPHDAWEVVHHYDDAGNLEATTREPDSRYPEGWAELWEIACP